MAKKMGDFGLPSYGSIFSSQAERDGQATIADLPIDQIDDFEDHPFHVVVRDRNGKLDPDMEELIHSIEANGIVTPALVRRKDDGRYEMISGHRRRAAATEAGLNTMPCKILSIDRDSATVLMVESNYQRTKILPSEKAFAYKMRQEAQKHQGKRADGSASGSADEAGKEMGDSGRQVQRYIRLTYLIPELLEYVDYDQIAFLAGVALSYLPENKQKKVLEWIGETGKYPTLSASESLKKTEADGSLTEEKIRDLLEGKSQIPDKTPPVKKTEEERLSENYDPGQNELLQELGREEEEEDMEEQEEDMEEQEANPWDETPDVPEGQMDWEEANDEGTDVQTVEVNGKMNDPVHFATENLDWSLVPEEVQDDGDALQEYLEAAIMFFNQFPWGDVPEEIAGDEMYEYIAAGMALRGLISPQLTKDEAVQLVKNLL